MYYMIFMSSENNPFDGARAAQGADADDRLLYARAEELLSKSGRGELAATRFLTPRQQKLVFDFCRTRGSADRLTFYGGAVGADRRMAVFLPSWAADMADCPAPTEIFGEAGTRREEFFSDILQNCGLWEGFSELIVPVFVEGSGYASLTHRDLLGSVLALGLRREVIGDIIVTKDSSACIMACPEAAKLILSELRRVGRDTVKVRPAEHRDIKIERHFENITSTVAAPRLDGVVRALCSVSREDAASLVLSGKAELNYLTVQQPDRKVAPGDILSVRGYGKFIIDRCEDETRRGRLRLEARKYI